jgi:hypothetical protein
MIRWLKFWGTHKDGPDPATTLHEAEQRLAEAKKLAADAQPTVQQGARLWRTNHIGEAAAAALHHYGSRP